MDLWFNEVQLPGLKMSYKVIKNLHTEFSEFQRIDVFETEEFGRAFTLDGVLMVTQRDEFVYHEMMAHLPSNIHPNPKKALVIGGGDGGTIRELAKYSSYEEIHLCELDKMVVDVSKEYFPEVAGVLTKDERVTIFYEDGIKFLDGKKGYYDVICVDSPDPIGPAEGLFKKDFYEKCYAALKDDGILIAQTESPWYDKKVLKESFNAIKDIFPISKLALASLLVYQSGLWSFSIGSKKHCPIRDFNKEIANEIEKTTKYYNSDIHISTFALPNFVKENLKK